MANKVICVLSGGAGTRLWPLSRESFPKQFYNLSRRDLPLLVETLERFPSTHRRCVLTTEKLRFSTMGLLKKHGMDASIIGEPEARNTAPAVALMTLLTLREDPSALIGVFPSDHSIANAKAFHACVERAFETAATGVVVTLGIPPLFPSTAYGYMELEGKADTASLQSCRVLRFLEKPDVTKAKELLATDRVLWNAGIFVFPAALMARHFEKHMPELWQTLATLKSDNSNLAEVYGELPRQSLDYGIIEKIEGIRCIAADVGWSDLGSWEEIAERSSNLGRPIEVGGSGNFYTGLVPEAKRVAFVGVSDLFAVDTPDALLIGKKGEGQRVKEVVEALKAEASPLLKAHTHEDRPWGRFEILMDTALFKTKRILVWPHQQLSYQSHKKRSEHWVIVKGQAQVTLDDKVSIVKPGDHIFIPQGAKHRVANTGTEDLEFIEVQTGSYFGEDDIVRYSDDYGRV